VARLTEEVGGRSALVVAFRLPAALEAIRLDHVDNARLGVPAHVTVLFPFVPTVSQRGEDIGRASSVVRRTPAFDVEFGKIEHWEPGATPEGVVWLPPDPAAPFIALTNALAAAFPGYLPYGGIHDEVIPHLTLANVGVDAAASATEACWRGPFRRRARDVLLLVEDEAGRWRTRRRLPLG
jgi:2'-5' RNA ligase